GRRARARRGPDARSGATVDARARGRTGRGVRDPVAGRRRHTGTRPPTARRGSTAMIRLMLADDHPVYAAGLRAVLDAEPDLAVAAVATTGRDALDAATDHRPDVAILDIAMPDGDGLWVTAQLRAAGLPTRVLILTMSDD